MGLEPAVPELGGGVNELQAHVLKSPLLSVGEQRFPESKNPFLGANTASLQHKEILLHLAIVRETTRSVKEQAEEYCVSDQPWYLVSDGC